MRKKEDWKTQADVDAIANRLLREAGGDLDRVHGNAVATALGMPKGNQSIYAKVDDWKKRMETKGIHHIRQAPTGLREELEERLHTGVEDIVRIALGLTGKTIDRERQRSHQTETLLGEKIALLESELDSEREARVLADSKVETMSKKLAALMDEAAAEKRRADLAEAKLDEVRGQHENLFKRLNVAPARSERVQEALEVKEEDEGYPIDMSRYDYEE
ncbi:hypothetical protein F7D01_04725 [Erythrobacter sp. 3-20A1M]|uniref:hypothetical protein n=1 Tax=Erythrobacter sp. 3-20A1M TaxID=2653850 RepID=UPI001BFC4D32|nr:hypothetical protein [Erythrobacter sp. 3-20A1M]QWC56488.1 hypothetical protein F7D01_04725 [Erythrobacter sp. 3-20A1M]